MKPALFSMLLCACGSDHMIVMDANDAATWDSAGRPDDGDPLDTGRALDTGTDTGALDWPQSEDLSTPSPGEDDGPEPWLEVCQFTPASLTTPESATCLFTPPADGMLLLQAWNPDRSNDGNFFVWETHQGRLPRLYTGTAPRPFYERQTTDGIENYALYVDATANTPLELHLQWDVNPHGENTGLDRLTISYQAGAMLEDGRAEAPLAQLSAAPGDTAASVSQTVELPVDGGLFIDVLSTGSGGGAHVLYLNDRSIGQVRTGDTPLWSPVVLRTQPGPGLLTLSHEDSTTNDNVGTRSLDLYSWAP
jgi:hypothetical protein